MHSFGNQYNLAAASRLVTQLALPALAGMHADNSNLKMRSNSKDLSS